MKSRLDFSAKVFFGEGFFSKEFHDVMVEKLNAEFYRQTHILDVNNLVHLSFDLNFAYISDISISNTQRLKVSIFVVNEGFYCWVVWKMKSNFGNPYRPFHSNIDREKFDMWFEGLPIEKIRNKYYEKPPSLSFNISGYGFKVKVGHIFADGMFLKIKANPIRFEEIELKLDKCVVAWNMDCGKEGYNHGVFHNSNIESKDDEFITYYLDLGSTGEDGIRYLLDGLDEIDDIESVEITSFV